MKKSKEIISEWNEKKVWIKPCISSQLSIESTLGKTGLATDGSTQS